MVPFILQRVQAKAEALGSWQFLHERMMMLACAFFSASRQNDVTDAKANDPDILK